MLGEDAGPGADGFIPFAGARRGAGARQLTFHEGGLEPTQDWKHLEVVFNSLDQSDGRICTRASGARARGRSGSTIWRSKSWRSSTS